MFQSHINDGVLTFDISVDYVIDVKYYTSKRSKIHENEFVILESSVCVHLC